MRAVCSSQGWPQLSESSQLAVVVSGIHRVALIYCRLQVTLYVTYLHGTLLEMPAAVAHCTSWHISFAVVGATCGSTCNAAAG